MSLLRIRYSAMTNKPNRQPAQQPHINQIGNMHHQQGSVSVVLSVLLTITLSTMGYFLYDAHESTLALNEDLARTERKLRTAERNLNETQSTLVNEQSKIYGMNSQQDTLRNQVNTLKEQLSKIEIEREESKARLNGELDLLKRQLSKTADDKAAVQQQLKDEIDTIKQQLSQTEMDKTQSQEALALAKQELQVKLTEKENEYEKKIAQLNEFSVVINQKYESTQEQLQQEIARSKEYSTTIESLEERLAREQDALDELNKQLTLLDKTNAELSSEKNRLVKQFKDGTTIIRLEDTILFSSGSAVLNERGTETLALVAKTLSEFPNHLISIEGHTDHRPIVSALAEKYPTNWELSSARAAFAIRYLTNRGLPETQFQAVGFASTRPITTDLDYHSQKRNRRIEILLHPPVEKITVTPAELMMKNKLTAK
jgi:chemotaxis protein MotB